MELTEIKTKNISWGQAAKSLNDNFSKVNNAVEQVKNATTRNKGYFSSSTALTNAFKSAALGDIAYVANGNGGYNVWSWNGSVWYDTGNVGGDAEVNLGNYYDKEEIDNKLKDNVFDGGRADSVYGGSLVIDCGTAYHN